ncbi:LexA family protein [Pantoea agglomerans]|jgi:SOS-response transcriptional repressor LexA|uniref:LexA family protein n=1 Tax=Pantoea TaxID=53335 RepID=UPI0009BCF351|nr:S24 family peptidase [Pantoea agglomerans]QIA51043.1 helix-turn-helix domain-containing protein [Pantoea agglomerans]WHU83008.1 S24 family peptidase [Pantoea agglomerans pv. betae]WLO83454.1 helix-turn-helix domain-containing protein [Pantoea agglomerans]
MKQYGNQTISDRIASKMRELNLRSRDIVAGTGASKSTVSQWVNGGNNPSATHIPKLAKLLNVTETWLINGGSYSQRGNSSEIDQRPMQKIPLVSLSQAGDWRNLMNQTNEFSEWTTVTDDVSPHAFSVEMDNDSMAGLIPEGAIVIFDPDLIPRSGQIVLANIGNTAVIKKLVIDGPSAYLAPINSGYKTIELESLSQIVATGISVQTKLP